ncbi:hypothetical protein HP924_000109 [Enterococcus faecium]|nr:hypothetical protein [Enterococcus faecium]EMF0559730.1 hypothetical protein [Enterococcus faecium]
MEIEMICPKCKENGFILNHKYIDVIDDLESNYPSYRDAYEELRRQGIHHSICKNENCNFIIDSIENVGYDEKKKIMFWKNTD